MTATNTARPGSRSRNFNAPALGEFAARRARSLFAGRGAPDLGDAINPRHRRFSPAAFTLHHFGQHLLAPTTLHDLPGSRAAWKLACRLLRRSGVTYTGRLTDARRLVLLAGELAEDNPALLRRAALMMHHTAVVRRQHAMEWARSGDQRAARSAQDNADAFEAVAQVVLGMLDRR